MKYYVIYEEYTEYNQFEGTYDYIVKSFDDFNEAKEHYEKISKCKNGDYRPPLFLKPAMDDE